jgi:integrase
MHKKLTQNAISRLHNDTIKDVFLRDTDLQGFGVKITPKNKIVFFAEGRIKQGKSKRVTLGNYPQLNLSEAKDRARKALTQLRDGIDPIAQEKLERAGQLARQAKDDALSVSLGELIESFFESRQIKSEAGYRKVIQSCLGDWLDKPVRSITRQMVEERYKKIAFKEDHKPQAAKAMRYLSSIMNYGKAEVISGEPLVVNNPVDILKEKRIDRTIKPKERYIERNQLFSFVRALMTECHRDARDVLMMELLTGLRDMEVKSLKWSDCDFKDKTITIRDNKSARTHIIPMGRFLYSLLQVRTLVIIDSDYVFPNKRGEGHIGDIRKQLKKVTDKVGIAFSHHDLRRTFATLLEGELKVSESIVGRLLNHSPATVTGKHYIKTNASRYTDEANKLYELIAADHDWTNDEGQKTGEGDWYSLAEREYEEDFSEGYERSLMHVLFGKDFINLFKEKIDVDWKYIDADMYVVDGVPWHYLNDHEAERA